MPATNQAIQAAVVIQIGFALAQRQLVHESCRERLRNVVGRQRAIALLLKRRDHPLRGVPCGGVTLGIVGSISDEFRVRVGNQHVKALAVTLLELQLERMIDGAAVVFIKPLELIAELRERK